MYTFHRPALLGLLHIISMDGSTYSLVYVFVKAAIIRLIPTRLIDELNRIKF